MCVSNVSQLSVSVSHVCVQGRSQLSISVSHLCVIVNLVSVLIMCVYKVVVNLASLLVVCVCVRACVCVSVRVCVQGHAHSKLCYCVWQVLTAQSITRNLSRGLKMPSPPYRHMVTLPQCPYVSMWIVIS